MIKQIIDEFIF